MCIVGYIGKPKNKTCLNNKYLFNVNQRRLYNLSIILRKIMKFNYKSVYLNGVSATALLD